MELYKETDHFDHVTYFHIDVTKEFKKIWFGDKNPSNIKTVYMIGPITKTSNNYYITEYVDKFYREVEEIYQKYGSLFCNDCSFMFVFKDGRKVSFNSKNHRIYEGVL